MTDNGIRIAIAEACGWTLEQTNVYDGRCWHLNGVQSEEGPPDYPNDLNAMREAEKVLWERNDWSASDYETLLQKITTSWAWHATALQRAEAFLRTIGKWKE